MVFGIIGENCSGKSTLAEAVSRMLERNHGIFDGETVDYDYDGNAGDPEALCRMLLERRG